MIFDLKKIVLLGLVGLIFPLKTYSQDSIHVNLDKALEIALNESPTINIAERTVQIKKYYKKEQIVSLFPDVSLSASYNRTVKKQVMAMEFNGVVTEISVGTDNNWGSGLSLYLPLVVPALWNNVKLSQLDVELAVESARSSRISLISEVKKAYYSHLLAKESLRVLLLNYANVELNNNLVNNKFNQGMASEFEKLRSDVQLKNQKPNLTAAENAVNLTSMMLKVLMGVDVNTPMVFDGTLSEYENIMGTQSIPGANSALLANNSSLVQMDLSIQQLEETRKLIASSSCPSLVLSGNYQYSAMNNDFKFADYNWYPYAVVGFTLQVPIVDWVGTSYKLKENKLTVDNIKDQKSILEQNLLVSFNSNIDNINKALEDLTSNKENMTQAERAYEISKRQYEVGMCTWLDLNSAELALTSTRLQYNQSIYDYLSAYAQLEELLGKNEK